MDEGYEDIIDFHSSPQEEDEIIIRKIKRRNIEEEENDDMDPIVERMTSSNQDEISVNGEKEETSENDSDDNDVTNSINTDEEDEMFAVDEKEKEYDRRCCCSRVFDCIFRKKKYYARTIYLTGKIYPNRSTGSNGIRNQKYNVILLIPQFLIEQFCYFANLYYLLTALSQFIPSLKVGYMFTYVAPLVFVLSVTFLKETFDDFLRWRRDREVNSQKYEILNRKTNLWRNVKSKNIKVGNIIKIHRNQRVPCDCILLKTQEKSGSTFIRTDQLDGETDWKLRHTLSFFQKGKFDDPNFLEDIAESSVYVEPAKKEIYEFFGRFQCVSMNSIDNIIEPLSLENTLWANTVIATGDVIALVIFTGDETRAVLNKTNPISKVGKLDQELNLEMKLLFLMMFLLSLACCLLKKQFEGVWLFIATLVRYIILYSAIIPISLRVNMDISKAFYAIGITTDRKSKGTVVRNSSIPEELGRIEYLFCDKTGTLTQNEMIFKKLILGNVSFNQEQMDQIRENLKSSFQSIHDGEVPEDEFPMETSISQKKREGDTSEDDEEEQYGEKLINLADTSIGGDDHIRMTPTEHRVKNMMLSIALCHNVTPVYVEKSSLEEENEDNKPLTGFRKVVRKACPCLPEKLIRKGLSLKRGEGGDMDEEDPALPSETTALLPDGSPVPDGSPFKIPVERVIDDGEIIPEIEPIRVDGYDDSPDIEVISVQEEEEEVFEEYQRSGGEGEQEIINLIQGEDEDEQGSEKRSTEEEDGEAEEMVRTYQASSPDEVALVKFSEEVNLTLIERTTKTITLQTPQDTQRKYEILMIFPFTSAAKRMGIVVRDNLTKRIIFFMKGADVVMSQLVKPTDWLKEEVDDLARDGLRTLVFAMKYFSQSEISQFQSEYRAALSSVTKRAERISQVRMKWETGMDCLGVTGVEDLLQENVQSCLENFRYAGIKVWMLTGDKVETAICIARSTRLVDKNQEITVLLAKNESEMEEKLDLMLDQFHQSSLLLRRGRGKKGGQVKATKIGTALAVVLDGKSLQFCLERRRMQNKFAKLTQYCSSVVCARCAPTQKAKVVQVVKNYSLKRKFCGFCDTNHGICGALIWYLFSPILTRGNSCCAIGDGGNDVAMIREADIGIGIVGKEGKQASLAADISITQYQRLMRLILWHGRNCYTRGAKMSQFIVHRGLIISIIQCVFSAIYFFATVPIFTGALLVGYSTVYTCLPVLAIMTDHDVSEKVAMEYPEIYKDLQTNKKLSMKTFAIWIWKACYQGGVIMLIQLILAVFFVSNSSLLRMQSIAFTALIFTELLMIILMSHRINCYMILAELISVVVYIVSIFCLPSYFDIEYILSWDFWWKVMVCVAVSCFPIYFTSFVYRKLKPTRYSKLMKERLNFKFNRQNFAMGVSVNLDQFI